jgi:hypothetical protein
MKIVVRGKVLSILGKEILSIPGIERNFLSMGKTLGKAQYNHFDQVWSSPNKYVLDGKN